MTRVWLLVEVYIVGWMTLCEDSFEYLPSRAIDFSVVVRIILFRSYKCSFNCSFDCMVAVEMKY